MKGENEDERGAPARHERECQTSEEDEESGNSHTKKKKNTTCTDGASIEVLRRPRGRPPGSKNKPKPPIIITRDPTDSLMHPHILQLPAGIDVVDSITRFARRRNVGLCILTGTGTVANVTLRHPTTTSSSSTVTFHGHFEILSISATFLPPSSSFPSFSNGFTISLAGAHGQIVGGSVVGSLVAAGAVVVVATAFVNPSFHRLPEDDEISASGVSVSGSETSSHLHQQQQHQQQRHGHDPDAMDCSSGMSIYSCHLPSDVIWAPIARPPSAPY